jgi:hypothetical protein
MQLTQEIYNLPQLSKLGCTVSKRRNSVETWTVEMDTIKNSSSRGFIKLAYEGMRQCQSKKLRDLK